jgi:hypothetical protein
MSIVDGLDTRGLDVKRSGGMTQQKAANRERLSPTGHRTLQVVLARIAFNSGSWS